MVRHKLRSSDFLGLDMLDGGELEDLLDEALRLKAEGVKGFRPLAHKNIGLLFEKPSTRTRVSFEVAVTMLGGHPLTLVGSELQLGRGESIEDTGKVLSRYVDGLVVRTFGHDRLNTMAAASGVPVINALTDLCHPCQALADMLTIMEYKGLTGGLKLAYVGDGNNVAHSLMRAGTLLGMNVTVSTPEGHGPDAGIVEECKEHCETYGSTMELGYDPAAGVRGADIVYTDVWVSMGTGEDPGSAGEAFEGFQVNDELLSGASDDVMVMHCLPAHRGEEITDEVIDGSHSAVWDQAENRLHAQVALLGMIFS
ncbi:MAG: ornithine carbamoyltransferase [Actinobacteria bacterium]|nr:ornithine carbamoyltransferase [Actinomycetota bacterium]MCG2818504.1 ornithine carbamoyltransferase [Actinomycetes bacterium]MBU4219400.1 ornithine carbamoyltransferase [Actinomycetota bacterium]MBU4358144.1 ornithine carbamoyltransferase [Actinomycetota bacterium]MBU4392564.1 ornithine carbamoyltransferase [Actinomycetota bacterium]